MVRSDLEGWRTEHIELNTIQRPEMSRFAYLCDHPAVCREGQGWSSTFQIFFRSAGLVVWLKLALTLFSKDGIVCSVRSATMLDVCDAVGWPLHFLRTIHPQGSVVQILYKPHSIKSS